jgi:NADPH:quinone reductase
VHLSLQTMRAVAISKPGGPEVLQVVDEPIPEPAKGEVLIKVSAAGVNRPDIMQRKGLYPPPGDASPLPGLEVAGQVVGMGGSVPVQAMDQRICALTNGGGYAEYVCVPWSQCLPVPKGLSMLEAASLPETFFTVWSNVFDRCRLQPGESLLVHGGGSGIGTAAIQMAKALGATVYVTAGSQEKCEKCLALGADLAVHYQQEDFVTVLKTATAGRGIDVILDMVAGPYVQRNLAVAAEDGRIAIIAVQGGNSAEINAGLILFKRLSLTGAALRPRSVTDKAAIASGLHTHIWPELETGSIRAVVDQVFPLHEAAAAHARLESGQHFGKIVLQVSAM